MASPTFGSAGADVSDPSIDQADFPNPGSVVANSVVVIPFYYEGTIDTLPSGFAHAPGSPYDAGDYNLAVIWKRASGSESADYTVTFTGTNAVEGLALRYEGCVTSGDPWEADFDQAVGTGSAFASLSITTTTADTLLFWVAGNFNTANFTPPQNVNGNAALDFTERFDGVVEGVADLAVSTATTYSSITGSLTGADGQASMVLALKSTAGGGSEVTGTAVSNLGALTASAVGHPFLNGTALSTLGGLVATASGHPFLNGLAVANLGGLAASAAGTVERHGSAVSSLGNLTATASGHPFVEGSAVSSLGGLNASANGDRWVVGQLNSILGSLNGTASGEKTVFGAAVSNLGALLGTILGTIPGDVNGSATALLGGLSAHITGGGHMANLITTQDLIDAIGREPYDAAEEAQWNHYIRMVSNYINAKVRVGFQSTTVTATYKADAYGIVYLREPVTDIASITNYRTGNDDFYSDYDGVNKLFFLEPHQVVVVTYTYGYATVPDDIQDLCVSLILGQIHEMAPTGLRRYKIGDVEEQYTDTRFARMLDDMTKETLDQYRQNWYSIPLTLEIFPDYQPSGWEEDFDDE